jgi:N-acetylglucosamine-6-phosphate deacetylase
LNTVALRGRIVTDYEVWPEGTALVEGDRIAEVHPQPRAADEVHEYPNHLILPGFVDLQVNGAFGIDVATEPERLGELSRELLSTGTTSFLPTVISSPRSLYRETLPALAELINSGVPGGAEALGIHLEGRS